jgi:hypothetical protein
MILPVIPDGSRGLDRRERGRTEDQELETLMKRIALCLLFFTTAVFADAKQVDEYHWVGVERIVAIGDLHGDYDNYMAVLKASGLVDRKGKWSGGKTHLVQTGDIPDRGPDTLKIIEHMAGLAKQAARKGGMVHNLIGNHEAMNVYGDLRYVSAGEYEAFVTKKSESLRDRYFEAWIKNYEVHDPEAFAALPENFREEWNTRYPLGWVEHRMAWDPAWNPEGEYARWVLENKVAIQINDTIFLHGGISGFYCQNSLESITQMVHESLARFDPAQPGIVEDGFGPLWYRGLSGEEPRASVETVDAILQHQGAKHIVVGHTPTQGVVWPLYDAKVIIIDTGIAAAYGSHLGYLEITPDGLFAGYPNEKLPLPDTDEGRVAYLEAVIAQDPDNPYLKRRLQQLTEPAQPVVPAATGADIDAVESAEDGQFAGAAELAAPPAIPTCGIVQ